MSITRAERLLCFKTMPVGHECFIGKSEIVLKSKHLHIFAHAGLVVCALIYSVVISGTQKAYILSTCLTICLLVYISSRIKEESLLMIPNVGICMKQRTLLGRSTSQFYDAAIVKDIVILEAVSLQQIVTYLAVISLKKDGSQEIHPIFMEDSIRQILEEMRALFEQNQKDVSATVAGEGGLFSGVQLRHAALERNKRCLLAYLYNRLEQIKKMRWEFGSVLPAEVKFNMCEQEVQWFGRYNKMLANYMRSIGGEGGMDLTQDLKPPKTLYIEVRCLMDHGEFETQDGNIVVLKKNTQHFLLRSECEHLIRQGILEHIVH